MGCTQGKPENVSLTAQEPMPFKFVESLVKKEKDIYLLKERVSLKSVFLGKDSFMVRDSKGEGVVKLKQTNLFDFGQDKMELKDKATDKSVAVIRRARMSFRQTFYIYTVEKPYPEAEFSNEDLDGEKMYCWGFLSTARGMNCIEDYEVGMYYWPADSQEDPKTKDHPYKPVYIFRCWTPCFDTAMTIGFLADEDGGVKKKPLGEGDDNSIGEAICKVEQQPFQWCEANEYGLEVAAGVDGGLMILVMAIIDEIREDQKEQN